MRPRQCSLAAELDETQQARRPDRAAAPLRDEDTPVGRTWLAMLRWACRPTLSEFYGIVIAMYYREHGVPHFHATYAGETVVVSIETGAVVAGRVPARALRLIQEWCELHRNELQLNWARARDNAQLVRIDPLA